MDTTHPRCLVLSSKDGMASWFQSDKLGEEDVTNSEQCPPLRHLIEKVSSFFLDTRRGSGKMRVMESSWRVMWRKQTRRTVSVRVGVEDKNVSLVAGIALT